jgi:hypothetical protein
MAERFARPTFHKGLAPALLKMYRELMTPGLFPFAQAKMQKKRAAEDDDPEQAGGEDIEVEALADMSEGEEEIEQIDDDKQPQHFDDDGANGVHREKEEEEDEEEDDGTNVIRLDPLLRRRLALRTCSGCGKVFKETGERRRHQYGSIRSNRKVACKGAAPPQLQAAAAAAAAAEAAAAAAAEQQKWLARQKRIGDRKSLHVGLKLRKLFVGHGVFKGVVKQKRRDDVWHKPLFRVEYEDGDAEDMTEVQLRACLRPA